MTELFRADILNDIRDAIASNPKVLVEFGAPWCQPCTAFEPHFVRFAQKHPTYLCVKVDVDVDPAVVSEYNIQSVPQVMLFENGEYVRTIDSDVRTVVKLEHDLNDEHKE